MDIQPLLIESPKITAAELFQAYYDCRRHKRGTAQALKFEMDLESNLMELLEEINGGTYEVGRSTAFIVDKPVKREVFAANFRDRIVHHLVIGKINKYIEKNLIYDCYSCRVEKGSHLGIDRLRHFMASVSDNYNREAWVLKLDIKGFFMSINRKLLFKRLREYLNGCYMEGDLPLVLDLCEKIIFNDPTKDCIYRCGKNK